MIKFIVIVLFYFCCVFRVSSAPIIKASGIQWTEPKGTGKGNITLIMIPQESSSSNDSDVIVAVKSDYQVMSQDTQLLNLIVNEKDNSKSNLKNYDTDLPNYINSNDKEESHGKIKNPNTAKYFESEVKRLPNGIVNSTVVSTASLEDDKIHIPEDTKVNYVDGMQVLEFLNMTNPSTNKPELTKNKLNLSLTPESLTHVFKTQEYFNTPLPFESSLNIYKLIVNMTDSNSDQIQVDKNQRFPPHSSITNSNNISNTTDPKNLLNRAGTTIEQLSASSESTVNILNFFNIIDSNNKNVHLINEEADTSTESTINIFTFLNATEPGSGNNISSNVKIPETKGKFFNEALTIIDNLKQNPSYYKKSLKYNGDFTSKIGNEREQRKLKFPSATFKDLKNADIALAPDEEVKESEYPRVHKKYISNVDEKFESTGTSKVSTIDTCESFFIIDTHNHSPNSIQFTSPKPEGNVDTLVLTFQKSSNNEAEKKEGSDTANRLSGDSKISNTDKNLPELTNMISKTTLMDKETSVAVLSIIPEVNTSPEALSLKSRIEKPSDDNSFNKGNNLPYQSTVVIPTEVKIETAPHTYEIEHPNIPPSIEMCTKIVTVQCNPSNSNGVFEQISNMIADKEEPLSEINRVADVPQKAKQEMPGKITLEPDECETVLFRTKFETITNKKETASEINREGESPQKAKQVMPGKITLEPKDECDSILFRTKFETSTNSMYIKDSNVGQLEENDIKLNLAESPAFLHYNNEQLKGFDFPTEISNSSLKLTLTGSYGESDYIHGGAAELHNDNPVVHNASKKPELVNSKVKNTTVLKGSTPVKEKGLNSMDVNNLLKMHFAEKNIISKQKFRENLEPEKNCEPTPEVDNFSEIEPDDEDLETQSVSSEIAATHKTNAHTTKIQEHIKTTRPQTEPQMKTTTKRVESSSDKNKYDTQTEGPLEKTSLAHHLTTESQQTKSKLKTTVEQLESSDQEEGYGISTSSSLEEPSLMNHLSTELQPEESSELLTTSKVTQKIKPLSTKSSVEENLESHNVVTGKTTTNKSPYVECEEESNEPQFSLSATITTQKLTLSTEHESKNEGSLHTQNNNMGKGNTKKYEHQSKEMTHSTGISSSVHLTTEELTPRTSLDLKSKHKPDQTCEKSIYIPSNSVKEVIIQIVKNTKKPGKHNSDSKCCYGARRDMQNVENSIEVDKTLDERNHFQEKIPSSDVLYNDNVNDKSDSKFSNWFSNMKEPRLEHLGSQFGYNEKTSS